MKHVIAVMLTIGIVGIIIQTASATVISVEPSYLQVSPGEEFTVNITVDPEGNETYGAQYILNFDNVLLRALRQKQGSFLSQDGANTKIYSNEINNTLGRTRYVETRMFVDYGVNSSGVLANITFRALEPGICTLNLSKVKSTKPDTQSIPDVLVNNGTVGIIQSKPEIFDTKVPANPYPSIFGTHRGVIIPDHDITVNKMYTYPCIGTGGHSESVIIWNETVGVSAEAHWNGYTDDYHNLSFNRTITLKQGVSYNYTIETGSYPQIIHAPEFNATGGKLNGTEFIDANGKKYDDWIVAIKLFFVS